MIILPFRFKLLRNGIAVIITNSRFSSFLESSLLGGELFVVEGVEWELMMVMEDYYYMVVVVKVVDHFLESLGSVYNYLVIIINQRHYTFDASHFTFSYVQSLSKCLSHLNK